MGVPVKLCHDRALEAVHELGKFPSPGPVRCPIVAAAHVHEDEDLLAALLGPVQLARQPLQLVAGVRPLVKEPTESILAVRRSLGAPKLH